MNFEVDDIEANQALDYNQTARQRDFGVDNGCDVTINTGTLGSGGNALTVAAGDAMFNGSSVSVSSQSVDIDTGGTNPRQDVVYLDSTGSAIVSTGTPEAVFPSDGDLTTFEYQRPAPNDLSGTDAVVLCTVWVAAGATSIKSSDVRDRRVSSTASFTSIDTEEQTLVHDGTPLVDATTVTGLTGSDGGTRGDEVLLEQNPNNPSSGSQRVLLRGHVLGENVILGRTYDDGGTIKSYEMLKPVVNGDVALEAEGDQNKLRLQESLSTSFLDGAVQLETSNGLAPPNDLKVARLSISGGQDPAVGVWRNLSRVQLEVDDAPFAVGSGGASTNWDGEYLYDSSIDHVVLDTKNTAKMILRAQGTDHIQLRGSVSKLLARLDLNGQVLEGPRVYNNAANADLGAEEVAIDENRGGTGTTAVLYKDASGTGHYWDADGTF